MVVTVNIDKIIDDCLEKFPNTLPTTIVSDSKLGKLVGQQEVIKYLTEIKEREEINFNKKGK